jgi:hypothetical protein
MTILQRLGGPIQDLFPANEHGQERARWFLLALQAILLPITASRTSNLLRTLATVFGWHPDQTRFYTFMASPKLPWDRVWALLWRSIPDPLTDGRLLLALDDSLNPKTGKKIFACEHSFDHAAKTNQKRYPWAQTLVTVGLLRVIHGRWACLPLAFAFYLRAITVQREPRKVGGQRPVFATKFAQAVERIERVAAVFADAPVLVIADSWFGNNGLWRPLRAAVGPRVQLLSRLRVNSVLYELPPPPTPGAPGRPHKYGARIGTARTLAILPDTPVQTYTVPLYGKLRDVQATSRVVMLKSLRTRVRVVWVFRKTQWVALFTTDLGLTVAQIIEYYGARWKIEAGFREIKQEIGSAQTQTRTPDAVTNHLHFCMAATTITWIYGAHRLKAPARRYATRERTEYAFGDLRRALARDLAGRGFGIECPDPDKPKRNPLIATLMDLVA